MAVRTTTEAVIAILDPDGIEGLTTLVENEELDLTPFIEIGSLLVDDVCSDSDYSATRLEHIERLLACHFYSVSLPKTKQEAAKGLTETYEGQTKLGLDFTRYGQQAKVIDYKGNLASIDVAATVRRARAGVYFVGGGDDDEEKVEI
jgi:hypothetical protein